MTIRTLSEKTISTLFEYLEQQEQYVFLDTSKPDNQNRQSLLFVKPIEKLQYRSGEDRDVFLEKLSAWKNRGYYLAGWIGYEFLHDFLIKKKIQPGTLLVDLGVYKEAMIFDHVRGEGNFPVSETKGPEFSESGYGVNKIVSSMEKHDYCQAIEKILEYIAAGDTYQVNYTFKFLFDFSGSVSSFYQKLRRSQPVPYGCCIKNGNSYIMSFSPELFFRIEDGKIFAKPMKGTMKRGRSSTEDDRHARFLKNDEKNRSENVMIVDLLRNDLSRLVSASGGGTVEVSSLFDIERYLSVFQMTSTVVAERFAKRPVTLHEIFQAIFPCGSITGAPKIRTMEIIEELEKDPRGVYTGAIGYFSPEQGAVFNVPIRTIVLEDSKGEMGIGSGIIADSSPEEEWEECLLKAKFLTNPIPNFDLIETFFYDVDTGYLFLEDHLERLSKSADYYDFTFTAKKVKAALEELSVSLINGSGYRVRLLLARDGGLQLSSTLCAPPLTLRFPDCNDDIGSVQIGFAAESTDSSQPCFFHKTTRRKLYNRAHEKAGASGLFDVLFCNEMMEVTEGCISNLFILKDGNYYTPPVKCGLLDGVMRKHLLTDGLFSVSEKILSKEDVLEADQVFVCNSVRGVLRARFTDS